MKSKIKIFLDKNGTAIKAGDTLRRYLFARRRERPGHKRVAISGMSGAESIVPDEGRLLCAEELWVTYKVGWDGACLIAERLECSDFQALIQAELFDADGISTHGGSWFYYFNETFDSTEYEIT